MNEAPPSAKLREAAAALCRHRLARHPLERLEERLRPAEVGTAYDLQDELHRQLTAAGLGPVAGHKIGCTTAVMQAYLKISTPCAGGVFQSTAHRSPAVVRHGGFVRLGVECEIVVRLGADLGPGTEHTRASVAGAVAACMAGMELVDARYTDYTSLDTPTLVADDFFNAGCVLGLERTDWRNIDLAACEGVTRINGLEAGRGRGADVMGHPFEALAWLARLKASRGQWLRAGEFVFLGSVVETRWVSPGDRVVMDIAGLGVVEAAFPP